MVRGGFILEEELVGVFDVGMCERRGVKDISVVFWIVG